MSDRLFVNLEELNEYFGKMIKNAVAEALIQERKRETVTKLYSVNQVAKKLGKAHRTIKAEILKNRLKTTSDGRHITEYELNKYLGIL